MCPPVTPWMMWAGCLCVFVAVVSAGSGETTVYGKLGGEVVLKPEGPSLPGSIPSIQWKIGQNIVIDFDGETAPRFENRVHLNASNGALTITGLMYADSGAYKPTVEDNTVLKEGISVNLVVISAVPQPTVTKSCDKMTRCTLTCAGNTTGAEPVTYVWKAKDDVMSESTVSIVISEEHRSHVEDFSCELKNDVSRESSEPILNPFFKDIKAPDATDAPKGELKISTGVTVFIILLTSVLLLAIFHRWKAGMWFFQQDSMPWQADFWRRQNGQPQGAAVSNGNPGCQQRTDEETPMT